MSNVTFLLLNVNISDVSTMVTLIITFLNGYVSKVMFYKGFVKMLWIMSKMTFLEGYVKNDVSHSLKVK